MQFSDDSVVANFSGSPNMAAEACMHAIDGISFFMNRLQRRFVSFGISSGGHRCRGVRLERDADLRQ